MGVQNILSSIVPYRNVHYTVDKISEYTEHPIRKRPFRETSPATNNDMSHGNNVKSDIKTKILISFLKTKLPRSKSK